MNILIPTCGIGKRFIDSGYNMIKPLIEINKKMIISYLIDRLQISEVNNDIYMGCLSLAYDILNS